MIYLIDHEDSFTYNLAHLLDSIEPTFVSNYYEIDQTKLEKSSTIVLSPGPGEPKDYPLTTKIYNKYKGKKKILGICLGHQYLASYYGSTLYNLKKVRHGISSELQVVDHDGLFKNIPKKFKIGHYHSWNVKKLSNDLTETALNNNGLNMAFRHKRLNVFGIQFHPESILTEHGIEIIKNWLLI